MTSDVTLRRRVPPTAAESSGGVYVDLTTTPATRLPSLFDCSLACMPRKKRTCRRAEARARLHNFREQTTTLRKPTSPGIRTMSCVAIPETVKFSFIEAVAKYRASSPKPRTARLRAAYANCCDTLTERGLANAATGPILSSGSGRPRRRSLAQWIANSRQMIPRVYFVGFCETDPGSVYCRYRILRHDGEPSLFAHSKPEV